MATPRRRSRLHIATNACFSFIILVAILGGIAFTVLRVGIGGEALTRRTQAALKSVVGPETAATIQSAQISLDQRHHVALEARDVNIADAKRGIEINNVRSVRIGLATLPLLQGSVKVERLELDGAEIRVTSKVPFDFMTLVPWDAQGLVDLDGASRLIFSGLESAVSLLDQRETRDITITDTSFDFTIAGAPERLRIVNLDLSETGGPVAINGTVEWRGKQIAIAAQAKRSAVGAKIEAFSLDISKIPLQGTFGNAPVPDVDGIKPDGAYLAYDNLAEIKLDGLAGSASEPARVWGALNIGEGPVSIGNVDDMAVAAQINFEHAAGSKAIDLKPSMLHFGAFKGTVTGAITPDATNPAEPAYRFELGTNQAMSSPQDSSEPALAFDAGLSGRYVPSQKLLDIPKISVRAGEDSELMGLARAIFGNGTPAMQMSLQIPHMPVAHAKQLWPVWVATGARRWVLENLSGGTTSDSRIDLNFAAGRFNGPGKPPPLEADELQADFAVQGSHFNIVGELPPVSNADGKISVRGARTTISLENGVAITPNNREAHIVGGALVIPWGPQRPVLADLDLNLAGDASAVAEIIGYKPINAVKNLPFTPDDIKGNVKAHVLVSFPITRRAPPGSLTYTAEMALSNIDLAKKIDGQLITDASGSLSVTREGASLDAEAKLNGIPADVELFEPLGGNTAKREQNVTLRLDDKTRNALFPALDPLLSGPISVDISKGTDGARVATADLTKAEIKLAQIGWTKGAGVKATAKFALQQDGDTAIIKDLDIAGDTFRIQGDVKVVGGDLSSADFNNVKLNRGDEITVKVARTQYGFRVDVKGNAFDARPLLNQITDKKQKNSEAGGKQRVLINADIDNVVGFYQETFSNVSLSYEGVGSNVSGLAFNAISKSGQKVIATDSSGSGARSINLQSREAGAVLRFFGFYEKMQGGSISVALDSKGDGPLRGQVDAQNFTLVNEPRLAKLVSTSPNGTSLNDAVQKNIDVSRVTFDRGFSQIEKGSNYINLANGVIRGPTIGTTFQGVLSDPAGNMNLTGTFMPAYGINRIFGELPILGMFLGNGRDRGLIGITYRLQGPLKQPQIIVNPISVIAPGIFRSIFEFQ
ncbi:RNA-binding protein [Phyllobacterium sp. SYP-B3895]|uniref:YhdP family protein n=1 Tax=Phyllobacterium sp. SYP-B3895 TaxID=2663240 RepID=UPI00129962D6|nr:RNA-binding protein [Phyllobacterium sp. SYP-B3895]